MTLIENDSPKVHYTGPFVKGQLLPLTFPYIAKTDVYMLIDGVPAELNKEFEIITEVSAEHPVAYPNSAYLKNALPNAKQITLYRVTPLDQQAPFPQMSKFRSERIEQALDKLTMQQQEQEEQLSRCIIAPITLETFNGQLPTPAPDQALKWNTEGTELENYDIIGEQEAFENDVNTRFEEQATAIENRIGQFEEETNTQFSEFRNEINENLEAVLNAADKLETLDQQVQTATDAANTALTSATKADEAAEEAGDTLEEIKQVIQDAEDTIGEIVQNTGFPMFSPQWSDHFYNDASFLRADTFSWHYADMYVTAYEEILKQYNNPEATEQTDGDIIYKLSPDGFRIALASEHDKVLERYLDGEKAWFYILDTENQCFKLPREKKTDGKYLYFYVGIYERPETEVNLGTVTDALNNKVDLDGGNYTGSGLEAVVNKNGGGGGLEIGDIGIAPLGIDETKGKRRYLNGQVIIQDQYKQFTKKVKSAVALYPSLACTESEWQTTATITVGGQVGKFVIDDNAGTIRLPKIIMPIQGLTDLSKLGEIVSAGLPSISHTHTRGTMNITGSFSIINNSPNGHTYSGAFTKAIQDSIGTQGIASGSLWNEGWGHVFEGFDASRAWTGSTSTNSAVSSIYGKSNTVQQEQIRYPYFIQVATGAETEDNIINEIELNNPYSFGDSKYSPIALNNLSWLKSEGQWNSKAVYPSFYDWALINLNNSVEGFASSAGAYTDYDFVLNTTDETFRLPLLDGSEDLPSKKYINLSFGSPGDNYTAPANGYFYLRKIASATNEMIWMQNVDAGNLSGAMNIATTSGQYLSAYVPVKKGQRIAIEYSASGATQFFRFIYAQGNGSLYFYVGETAQNANLVNIGRIQEQYTTKSMVDGRWVKANKTLASSFSLASQAVATYNLDSILPNDGYNYEVWFTLAGRTGETNGNSAEIRIGSDLIDSSFNIVCANVTRTSASAMYAGTTVTPVGVSRSISITNTGHATASITYLRLAGYRRIGTNL